MDHSTLAGLRGSVARSEVRRDRRHSSCRGKKRLVIVDDCGMWQRNVLLSVPFQTIINRLSSLKTSMDTESHWLVEENN